MKTEDIKKMAQAWQQVQEASKKNEELKGNQHKIDHDKDGKITAADFKGLRKKSKKDQEVEVQIDEISSDLKSRYAKKAQSSLKRATTYKAKAQDDAKKASANIDRANSGDRSVNVNKQYDRIDRADAKVAKHDKTIAKRTAGLKRANEEFELDEVTDQERLSARKIQRDAQTARHGIARKPGESMVAYLTRAEKHKKKMQKEEAEWPVYERIKESRAAHYKGATKPETMDDKLKGKGAKDMANQPVNTSDIPATHLTDIQKASAAKKAPARTGDQTKGDKSIVNPVKDTTK